MIKRILFIMLFSAATLFAQRMEVEDVRKALAQAVQESLVVSPDNGRVIAITDREGHVLAVWSVDVNGPALPNPTPSIVADDNVLCCTHPRLFPSDNGVSCGSHPSRLHAVHCSRR